MSVAYCVAVALIDGSAFLDQFTEQRVRDRQLLALVERTNVILNSEFDALSPEERDMTVVRCVTHDGQVFETSRAFAKGHPSDPMSEEEVVRKYRTLVGGTLSGERADWLESLILNLESIDNSQVLSGILGAAS